MQCTAKRNVRCVTGLAVVIVWGAPVRVNASETGQGSFETILDEHPVHCTTGVPITTGYTSTFNFDDKTFNVNLPGEQPAADRLLHARHVPEHRQPAL